MLIYFSKLRLEKFGSRRQRRKRKEEVAVPFLPPLFETNQKSKTLCVLLGYIGARTSNSNNNQVTSGKRVSVELWIVSSE